MTRVDYWNHNVHYQPVILNAVPGGCGAPTAPALALLAALAQARRLTPGIKPGR